MSINCNISSDKNILNKLSCPSVDPVPEGTARPFYSVMIPTYNPDLQFLEQVLRSVLEQDSGPEEMQIEIIDDCSEGFDLKEFLRRVGGERVLLHRQKHHTGIGGNWNTCIKRARGIWVHILHQDDLLLSGFYNHLRKGIEMEPSVGAAFCRDYLIDSEGNRKFLRTPLREPAGVLTSWLEHVFIGLSIRASSLVVKRSVYEKLGGFNTKLYYALDWDMWKRIASCYPIWYESRPLACYRQHDASASSEFIRSGCHLAEIRQSIDISQSYLPNNIAADISRRARRNYMSYGLSITRQMLSRRDFVSAIAQVREIRKLSSNTLVNFMVWLTTRAVRGAMRYIISKIS